MNREETPQLKAALGLCDAIGDNVRLSMNVMYRLREIAGSMRHLGLMLPIADELCEIGEVLHESARAVSGAQVQSTNASIRAQEEAMGETLMALLDHASGMETRSATDAKRRGPKGDSPTAESGDAQRRSA